MGLLCAAAVAVALASPAAGAPLPDGRAYELVTPPDLLGPSAIAITTSVSNGVQPWSGVAADGDAALWSTRAVLPGVDSTGATDAYVARRTPAGWRSSFVSPPGSKAREPSALAWAATDLVRQIWLTFDATIDPADQDLAQPGNTQQYADLYREGPEGSFARLTQGSQVTPAAGEGVGYDGTSSDGGTVLFTDDRQLEPDAAPSGQVVYARTGSTTVVVSKDAAGAPLAPANGQALSDDGAVAAFATNGSTQGLYLRDRGLTRTVHLADFPANDLDFESLSSDGSKTFFTTAARLTADDTDNGIDLYEYDDDGAGTLIRLSRSPGAVAGGVGDTDACSSPLPDGAGNCDIGPVAVTRDGATAYFVSPEQFDGARGTAGAPNLYAASGAGVRFVATLDPSDPDFGGASAGSPTRYPFARHVRLTPDGSELLFESRAPVISYDNAGHVEVYVYDSATQTVTCASCRPSGAPPTGDASLRDVPSSATPEQFSTSPLSPANADEHGDHIFFQSSDPIVARDTNGHYDVYEYTAATRTPALISSGLSPSDSAYLGNGVDGRDVFFFTSESLVPQDRSAGAFKIYDARVGGGLAPVEGPPPCHGDGCRGPAAPPPPAGIAATELVTGSSDAGQASRRSAATAAPHITRPKAITGTSVRLGVKVAGRGRLRASGDGVLRATTTTTKAATYHMTVKLSARSRQTLKRRHRVKLSVTVRFTPQAGAPSSARVALTFEEASA